MDETLKLKRPPISPSGIAGAVNTGARALAAMPAAVKAAPPVAAPSPLPTDVPNTLKRQGQMFAPFTAHFQGPDAAAAKLVDHRLKRAGGPMPSQVGPPAPTQPSVLQRLAPNATAAGERIMAQQPSTLMGRLGQSARLTAEAVKTPVEAAGTLLGRAGSAVAAGAKDFGAGFSGAPPATKSTRPIASPSPAGIAGAVNAGARALSAPALAALPKAPPPSSTKLPGAPTLDANGNPVYDDAFAARNPQLLQRYQQQNVVQSVVPPPGVAATMAGGQTPAVGQLTRGSGGFTAADRMAQLDTLDRLGNGQRERQAAETATQGSAAALRLARFGDPRAAGVGAAAAAAGQVASGLRMPPRIGQMDPNAPAANANEAARIAIEQGRAQSDAALTQVQTQQGQLQLKQAQQMQALTEQLLNGSPDQQKAAAASLAALQGTKPGEPIKVTRQVNVGSEKYPLLADQELLYEPSTGRWMQPPTLPPQAAIDHLRANDTPAMREAFKQKFGIDPATVLG